MICMNIWRRRVPAVWVKTQNAPLLKALAREKRPGWCFKVTDPILHVPESTPGDVLLTAIRSSPSPIGLGDRALRGAPSLVVSHGKRALIISGRRSHRGRVPAAIVRALSAR